MKNPSKILKKVWGYQEFRGSQLQVINTLLKGDDVLALMPTGGGKSLCYQIPALAREGICVVISPLVALIQNQVASLKNKGVKAIAITGGISFEELNQRLDNCVFGGYKFLYLSPERLQQSNIKERIMQMNVNLVAIDEAHCISQWGNDFRPAYLNCSILRELAPDTPFIGLTATATKNVSQDIIENLRMNNPLVIRDSFERKNLAFTVKKGEDKKYQLSRILQNEKGSTIVYVGTRKKTVELCQYLKGKNISVDFFHGGLSQSDKKNKLNKWLEGGTQVMVATNAFGMGIDKANVRNVVHYRVPDSLENYFQEAGRAGRDGETSRVTLLTNKEDEIQSKKQYLDMFPDSQFLKLLYKNLNSHFQIPYGEGNESSYDFDFSSFCTKYNLSPVLAHNGLKLLDQHSIISLSESFHKKTLIQFLPNKEKLFRYIERNTSLAPLVQTLLRTYGGLFDFETNINLGLIEKKLGMAIDKVQSNLQKLKVDGIINLTASSTDLSITFLVPREDERTVNKISQKIKTLRNQKKQRLQKMVEFVQNESECRSVFLLNYFGEEIAKDCGICDICEKNKKNLQDELPIIKNKIMELTATKSLSSRELASLLNFEELQLLPALKELLEEELLIITTTNAYKSK